MKVIDLLNKIANGEEVPKEIKASRMTWYYEKGFSQYKNSNCQELIKYLNGHYSNFATGLTYKAILNYEVEIIDYFPERLTMLGMLKRIKNKGKKFKKQGFLIFQKKFITYTKGSCYG